jgi:hypothetical protein
VNQELISLQIAESKYACPVPEIQEKGEALALESTEPDAAPPAQASNAPATLRVNPAELEMDPEAWPETDPDA